MVRHRSFLERPTGHTMLNREEVGIRKNMDWRLDWGRLRR